MECEMCEGSGRLCDNCGAPIRHSSKIDDLCLTCWMKEQQTLEEQIHD